MLIGPEKLAEIFNRGSKTGPAINSPVNRCAGCPFAGRCTPCKPTSVISEVSVFKSTRLTTSENVGTKVGIMGSLYFRPIDKTVGPRLPEQTCSQCGKNPNTCPHTERGLRAA